MSQTEDIFKRLELSKKLTAALINEFQETFGESFFKSLEYIQGETQKLKMHHFKPSNLILWTVVGKDSSYILYENLWCSCQNFLIDSIYRAKKFKMCKHLLAQRIGSILSLYDTEIHKDTDYTEFCKNLVLYQFSSR